MEVRAVSDDISRAIQEQARQNEIIANGIANDNIQRGIFESGLRAAAAANTGGNTLPSGTGPSQGPTPDPLQQFRQTQGTDNVPRGNETFQQQVHHIATDKNQKS